MASLSRAPSSDGFTDVTSAASTVTSKIGLELLTIRVSSNVHRADIITGTEAFNGEIVRILVHDPAIFAASVVLLTTIATVPVAVAIVVVPITLTVACYGIIARAKGAEFWGPGIQTFAQRLIEIAKSGIEVVCAAVAAVPVTATVVVERVALVVTFKAGVRTLAIARMI